VTEPRQQSDGGAAAVPNQETSPAPEASAAAKETEQAPEATTAPKPTSNGRGLVELENVKVYFPIKSGLVLDRHIGDVRAVDDVTLTIERGETLGLVGESGCGKSTVGRAIIRLYQPTAGTIRFDGQDITNLGEGEMRPLRRRMQMVFQDPFASLNPRHSVGRMIGEPLRVHGLASGRTATRRVRELLEIVGLPADAATRYAHEFSGGQRQRIGIARALALNPDFIVADEPVSALDVSIQAQIINLLENLQSEFDLTYLFIAHDLAVVRHISDRIAVMYLGKVVEIAPAEDLYENPLHPYTIALLSAIPIPDPVVERTRETIRIYGDLPSPANPPAACRFHTRCPFVQESRCRDDEPLLRELEGHQVACHWAEDIKAGRIAPKARTPVFDPGLQPAAWEPPPT
jgi:peptide/nickel transport system ATP-binding protein